MRYRVLLLAVFVSSAILPAQKQAYPADLVTRIEKVIDAVQKKAGIPGLAVAIGRAGVVRYARGFGKADLENDVPATARTRFRTASIAKSMTAVAVMQLVEKGKIELGEVIRTYVPGFPKKRWPFTVRHLLCHQSGVRHYARRGESTGTRPFPSLASSLVLFRDDRLLHEPGRRFTYTTYGYTLLGCAVEHASEMRYDDYLRKCVWDPAGMGDTCVDQQSLVVPRRTRFYMRVRSGQILNASLHDTSMKIPGGGLLSTAPDLVRFGMAMLGDKLVEKATRDTMWTPRKTAGGEQTPYGLGFRYWDVSATRFFGHTGGQAGTSCAMVVQAETGVVVAIMCNLERAGRLNQIAARIAKMVVR